MSFEQTFTSWLERSLGEKVPSAVKAFSFNLYEPAGQAGVQFGIELIGASKFDGDDSDWACEEVWEPKTRGISIPIVDSGSKWQTCLDRMKKLILKQLKSKSASAERLKRSEGIGLGFVDGGLQVIWRP